LDGRDEDIWRERKFLYKCHNDLLKLFVIWLNHILDIVPVEKTLNRHIFTILKTCFLDLRTPFP
jgi:hypothetical protein